MKARMRVDKKLLEEIDVRNGLRQVCTMAPALFNLYACAVFKRWLTRIKGVEGAGTYIPFKMDQKLFIRYTKNAQGSVC